MKKIAILTIAASLVCGLSFAQYQPNPETWTKIKDTPDFSMYYNKTNAKYDPATDRATYWLLSAYTKDDSYIIYKQGTDYTNRKIIEYSEVYLYPGPMSSAKTLTATPGEKDIIPGTMGDIASSTISEYVGRDEKHEEYQKEQNHKKQNEKNEETLKKGLSVLRGIF